MTNSIRSENLLQAKLDGLPTRPSGAWVKEKLHYLSRYIYMFSTSMRDKPWRSRRYIDLFAGSGKCRVRGSGDIVLGSPLIALATDHPFTDYVYVDSSEKNMAALKRRCEATSLEASMSLITADANVVAGSIAKEIIRGDSIFIRDQWWSLILAFLDPEGLELEWDTVAALAQVEKMDMIIHYSQSGITRNFENCVSSEEENIVDKYFGDRKWREIYVEQREQGASSGRIHRKLMDYYKSKLAGLGYVVEVVDREYGPEPLIRNTRRNAPLYRLMFASKHELGHEFWRKVTGRDVYGQRRLL